MTELVVKPKNKREEKVVQAFLDSLEIGYYTEAQEEEAMYRAMIEGRKTKRLTPKQKEAFIRSLKNAR
jgi:hypothetical protein